MNSKLERALGNVTTAKPHLNDASVGVQSSSCEVNYHHSVGPCSNKVESDAEVAEVIRETTEILRMNIENKINTDLQIKTCLMGTGILPGTPVSHLLMENLMFSCTCSQDHVSSLIKIQPEG